MSELKCKECGISDIVQDGTQSPCQACGTKFSPENINQDEVEATNNQTPQQYNGTTQQYMVLNSRIIQSAASTRKKKSMDISRILSIILVGFGLVYIGFIKRWLVALVISIVLPVLFLPLGFIWFLYML